MNPKSIANFWMKVEKTPICWFWRGSLDSSGYGTVGWNGKTFSAHRFSYRFFFGEIPKNLVIDHLCKNRNCVHPRHMELVTDWENNRRGNSFAAKNYRKTHCIHGHKLTKKNTYLIRYGKNNHRRCRKCITRRTTEWRRRCKSK